LENAIAYFAKARRLFIELGDERRAQMCGENLQLLNGHLAGKA